MKNLMISLFIAMTSMAVWAEGDHAERETITGSGFEMAHVQEVLVGTFNNMPIWAGKKCGDSIVGQFKKNLATPVQNFRIAAVDKVLTATFDNLTAQFHRVDRENKVIELKNGEKVITFHYDYESFADGHFKNITWNFENNGQSYTIHLAGEGCLGSMIFYSLFFYGMTSQI